MHFVGLDLAWGTKAPTGVAVLDATGQLLHVCTVRTDDEIVATVGDHVGADDPCLVGIDAPLIVTNPTGNRAAERQLNSDFARFDAGAHPMNTGKSGVLPAPRGAIVSELLHLDFDPSSQSPRRAIEVYPHPAMVALFRLGRTLKYKNKPGRTLARLQEQSLELIRLLETLVTAEPPLHLAANAAWRELVSDVERASRKSELRRAEDQIDAVVCAYIALFREHRPSDTTTYGDLAHGYIVTPTLPADLQPSPRTAITTPATTTATDPIVSSDAAVVSQATRQYAAIHPQLRDAAEQAVATVTGILDDAGLNYLTVTGRAKSVASFAAKAARTVDGELVFADPLTDIGDVIGVRVITYVHSDVAAVADLLADEAQVIGDRDMGEETASEGRFGYASRHLQIVLSTPATVENPFPRRQVQVQIRTVLQHAWAEFEHDIRYKGSVPDEHRSDFDRRFTLAAGLLELADQEFSTIRQRLQHGLPAPLNETLDGPLDGDPRISPQELTAFLAGQYSDADFSRADHYVWIARLLLELGITSLAELADTLRPIDNAAIASRMDYRHPPGAVRRLDDALLMACGAKYVSLPGNSHRVEQLQVRLDRLRGT